MKQKILLLCAVLVSAHLFDTNLRAEQTIRISQTCTEITVKPATLKLPINETSPRLSYGVEPAGTKVQISWASDNEEVATVNAQGIVTGVGYGSANITCTDAISGAKDTCVVTVTSLIGTLDFTEAYIGYKAVKDPVTGESVPAIDSSIVKYYDKTLCEQLGVDSLNAYIATLRVQLFSGLYFNARGTLDGAERGGYIIGYAPAILASKEANPAAPGHTGLEADKVLTLGDFVVDSKEEPTQQHHMQIGQLNNDTMMYYLPKFFADFNKNHELTQEGYNFLTYGQICSVTGTELMLMAYDAKEGKYASYPTWLWQYFPNAIITGGEFNVGEKQGSSKYMYQIDYIDLSAHEVLTDDFGIPGVFVDHSDENNVKMLSTGWELSKEYTYHSGTKPSNSAKRMVRGIPMTELSHPIILPSLEEDRKIRETFERNLSTNLLNNKALHIDNAHKTSLIGYEITACAAGCDLCHSAIAEQGEQVKIYANAVDEGNFLFWNDGNTDNPRIIAAQKDTTLIAYFGMSYQCGDNLTWSFDFNTRTLYINGTGPMYDYYSDDSPWSGINSLITHIVLNDGVTYIGEVAFANCSGLTSVTIPNSVTSIGSSAFHDCSSLPTIDGIRYADTYLVKAVDMTLSTYKIKEGTRWIGSSAFYGCSGLTSITIPNSVTSIGERAFYYCSGLRSITCYAVTPPTAAESTFEGVSQYTKTYVLASSLEDYQFAIGWRNLNLLPIGGTEIPITKDDVTVTPSTDNATFTWPASDQAEAYSLEITKDGVVFCTLKFNALGQLIGIAFAPGINGNHRAPAAVMTANGWQFTVTGLNQASKYTYKMDVTDAAKQVIKSYKGEFATDGYTDLLTLPYEGKDGIGSSKFIQNGQLYILRDGVMYNVVGGKVAEM